MIEIEALELRVRQFALGPLSLSVGTGDYWVLLGASGAGKTTLLECLGGFRQPEAGRILIGGRDTTGMSPAARELAYVFQEAALFPHLTVQQNIQFALKIAGQGASAQKDRCEQVAESLRISHRLNAMPASLSGGEARRVSLARALAMPRRLLLLDEPLTAVDRALHRDLVSTLRDLHQSLDLTVVHVTHSLLEARNLSTHIGVLEKGELRQCGKMSEVFAQPNDRSVARALGVANFVQGRARPEESVFELNRGGAVPAPQLLGEGSHATVHGLTLVDEMSENSRPGLVTAIEHSESGLIAACVRLDGLDFEWEVPISPGFAINAGDRVRVSFESAMWRVY